MKKKILMSWSGGKDSAWALQTLLQDPRYEVTALLTSVNSVFSRVAIHGYRTELLELQAQQLDLPLWTVPLPFPCTNAQYETAMAKIFATAQDAGITGIAFGDLFLEDVRAYRERQLTNTGLEPLFPIWGLPTLELARQMVSSGIRGRLTCVDLKKLDISFAGREFDESLLNDLPESVDHCGENGEFHTFVFAGPMFKNDISVQSGEIVERDGFAYADLV